MYQRGVDEIACGTASSAALDRRPKADIAPAVSRISLHTREFEDDDHRDPAVDPMQDWEDRRAADRLERRRVLDLTAHMSANRDRRGVPEQGESPGQDPRPRRRERFDFVPDRHRRVEGLEAGGDTDADRPGREAFAPGAVRREHLGGVVGRRHGFDVAL